MPLPIDFDAETYLQLNRDVRLAGEDAAEHYLTHGLKEGRRYRPYRDDAPPHWKICDFPDGGEDTQGS